MCQVLRKARIRSALSGWRAIASASASSQVRPRSCSMFQSCEQTSAQERLALGVVGDQRSSRRDADRSGPAPGRRRRRYGGFRSSSGRLRFRRARIGGLDGLFHDARQRLRRRASAARPPMAGRARRCRAPTSARSIESRSAKCVKTCSTGRASALQSAVSGGFARSARLRSTPFPALRSCRRAARAADGGEAGSRRRCGARRRPCRSASGAPSSAPCAGSSPGALLRRRGMAPTRGRARRRAFSACRSWRRDPSAPRRIRPRAAPERAAEASRGSAASRRGAAYRCAKSRATTRSTLPSTTATGSSKAIAAIAAEV